MIKALYNSYPGKYICAKHSKNIIIAFKIQFYEQYIRIIHWEKVDHVAGRPVFDCFSGRASEY